MNIEIKLNIIIFVSYFLFFCIGAENGIIIPTILEYLRILENSNGLILGISIAGYCVGSASSIKLMKKLLAAAKKVHPRLVLLGCCCCYITGCFLYTYSGSLWGVVIARCLCGLGSGATEIINNDVTKNCVGEEFDKLHWNLKTSLTLGWLLAPIFSVALILPQYRTSSMPNCAFPGLVCGSVFVVLGVLTIAGYCELGKTLIHCRLFQSLSMAYERMSLGGSRKSYGATSSQELDSASSKDSDSSEEQARIHVLWITHARKYLLEKGPRTNLVGRITGKSNAFGLTLSDEILENAERMMGDITTPNNSLTNDNLSTVSTPGAELDVTLPLVDKKGRFHIFYPQHWLGTHFLTAFLLGSILTMLTPLTELFYNFGGLENASLQLGLGVMSVTLQIALSNSKISNKILLVMGSILALTSLAWLLVFCSTFENDASGLPLFCIGILGVSLACSTMYASNSKDKHLVQWVTGFTVGPLWAGSTVNQPRLMLGGQLALVLISTAVNFLQCD